MPIRKFLDHNAFNPETILEPRPGRPSFPITCPASAAHLMAEPEGPLWEMSVGSVRRGATIPCPLPPRTGPTSLITNQSLPRSNESLSVRHSPTWENSFRGRRLPPKTANKLEQRQRRETRSDQKLSRKPAKYRTIPVGAMI